MSRTHRTARALWVVAVLLIPPAILMPRALFGGWVLSPADALFSSCAPWSASPPAGFAGAQAPQALEATLRFDPGLEFADEWLKRGRLPVWNPWNGFGEPFLGHARAGAFNPLDVLRLVFATGQGRAFRTAFFLFLAGWFAYRLLLLLGVSRSSALFGALAYAMNGLHLARIHYPDLRVLVLLPFLLWTIERLLRRPEGTFAAGTGLAVGLVFLADHPETGMPLILSALAYAILRSLTGIRSLGGPERLFRAGIWLAIALGLGVALGWVQIGLTVANGAWPVGGASGFVSPESLLGLFAPGLFGPPGGGWWGAAPPTEGFAYFGVVAVMSAFIAVATGLRSDPRVRALSLLAVGGAVLIVGRTAPVISAINMLPGFEGVAGIHFTPVLALAGAALAALGVERCRAAVSGRGVSGWVLAGSSALVYAGLLVALWRYTVHHPDQPIAELWEQGPFARVSSRVALAAAMAAVGVGLLSRLRSSPAPRACIAGLLGLVLLDLWVHGHEQVSEIERRYDREPVEALRSFPGGRHFAGVGAVLPPMINLGLGCRDVRGRRCADLPRMSRLLDRHLPCDPETGLTGVGPSPALIRFGVNTWISARSFGPESVRCVVAGPPRSTGQLALRANRPVTRLTLHTSLDNAWTLEEGRAVAEVVVVGREREVKVVFRAGRDTGDTALERSRAFARHARPTPSGSWSSPDDRGTLRTRHCYPRTLELKPPLTPDRLRITWLGGDGSFRIHRVDVDTPDAGFAIAARLGTVTRVSNLFRWRAHEAAPDAFLSAAYRVVAEAREATAANPSPSTGGGTARPPALRFEPVHWTGPEPTEATAPKPTPLVRRDHFPGRFSVDLPPRASSAVLVIREAVHPGWSATSNSGKAVPIEPVDAAFLGAVLPPGPAETVTFTFVPPALVSGLWVSGLAAIVLIALAAVGFTARRRMAGALSGSTEPGPSPDRAEGPPPGDEDPVSSTPPSDVDPPDPPVLGP